MKKSNRYKRCLVRKNGKRLNQEQIKKAFEISGKKSQYGEVFLASRLFKDLVLLTKKEIREVERIYNVKIIDTEKELKRKPIDEI